MFNVSELGISTEHIPPKIVASRGRTPLAVVSNRSATTTIISTVSAIGQVLPPYKIFKGKRMCDDLLAGAFLAHKQRCPRRVGRTQKYFKCT